MLFPKEFSCWGGAECSITQIHLVSTAFGWFNPIPIGLYELGFFKNVLSLLLQCALFSHQFQKSST